MAELKHTTQEIIDAVKGSAGIKATIARKLGVHRNTVERYIKMYPTVGVAYENECETVSDMAQSKLIQAMNDGDVGTIRWWLARKRRAEFGDNVDVTSGGESIRVILEYANDTDKPD